jgi:hypothetical protein
MPQAQHVGTVNLNRKKDRKGKTPRERRRRAAAIVEDRPRAKMGKAIPHPDFKPLVRGVKK